MDDDRTSPPSAKDAESAKTAKEAARREILERLATIDPATAHRSAERLADRVMSLPETAAARSVLACLSFGEEIDTHGLVKRLLASGRAVYVPRADPRDRMLHVHRYPCALETLSFGLSQPRRGDPEVPADRIDATIDLVLVLGLGFDRRGIRLGHGGGYFDRFFAAHPLPAVGVAYELQMNERLPSEPHDLPMTVVVTDEAVHRPAGSAGL